MSISIFQVDAFTDGPFKGNPAGVVLLDREKASEWMASIATEMNLSETAFLIREDADYHLRWFTPEVEVQLCGHATLASAHILWEQQYLEETETAVFRTLSGKLKAVKKKGWIEMDFPAFSFQELEPASTLTDPVGGKPVSAFSTGENLMLVFESPEEIASLVPDMNRVAELPYQGVIATSRGDGMPYDFVSRYFAPKVGIEEDPVTGSAHSSLAPYWAKMLEKNKLAAYQASERGGVLQIRLWDERVFISGQAVTVFSGKLLV